MTVASRQPGTSTHSDQQHAPAADAGWIEELFEAQRRASRTSGPPTLVQRQGWLAALAGTVVANRLDIQAAMEADFGRHPEQLTFLTEVLGVAGQASYVSEQLPGWLQPDQRSIDPTIYGSATAEIRYEPKGVVGIIAPWNFPFLLSLGPLVDALAAGNRVLIKPSEHAPACAEVLRRLVSETFPADLVAVVCGGVETARRFSSLPFDHLLYTGSTAVGREVAVAAARNLTPVTLELGGKNPAIVHEDAVTAASVRQIVGNKLVKNGQVCIAPDYVLVPAPQVERFVELTIEYMAEVAPTYATSSDCAGMISDRHAGRIVGLVDEARERGCEVVTVGGADDGDTRRLPLALILDPPEDIALSREEIFGPVLPVIPYSTLDDAIAHVNAGDRPLGLYVFAEDEAVADDVLRRTASGGACINTCAIQGVLPSLGFGGTGSSGHGRHRGIEGFRALSTERGVVTRGEGDLIEAFFPPYAGLAQTIVTAAFGGDT